MNDTTIAEPKVFSIIIGIGKGSISGATDFEYKSSEEANQKYKVTGILGTYGGGGLIYKDDIYNIKLSTVFTQATRALIIEWTMYNPSEQFYAYCRIVLLRLNFSSLNILLLVLSFLHTSMSDPSELNYTKVHATLQ
jgi:hypothetical protein